MTSATQTTPPGGSSRLVSAETFATAVGLMRGNLDGELLRPPGIWRLLGVPLAQRGAFTLWVEENDLWFEPPFDGPLAAAPNAGTIDAAVLREALSAAIKSGKGLPFATAYLSQKP